MTAADALRQTSRRQLHIQRIPTSSKSFVSNQIFLVVVKPVESEPDFLPAVGEGVIDPNHLALNEHCSSQSSFEVEWRESWDEEEEIGALQ